MQLRYVSKPCPKPKTGCRYGPPKKPPVRQPWRANTSAAVTWLSFRRRPFSIRPWPESYRPVSSAACAGRVQEHVLTAVSKRTPSRARRSIVGLVGCG